MSTIGISLGWDCQPAIIGLKKGLRPSKEDGYKSCPFDMMLSNYPGLIECLNCKRYFFYRFLKSYKDLF